MSVAALQGHQYNDIFSPFIAEKKKVKIKVSLTQVPQAMTPRRAADCRVIGGIMLHCVWSRSGVLKPGTCHSR